MIGLMGGDMGADLAAAHESGIEQPHGAQRIKGCLVVGEMLRLAAHWLLEGDAKPDEVIANALFESRSAAGEINVLDAQQ